MMNLIGNAVKFVTGRSRREVRISARRVGSDCRVTISDTGPGIPEGWRTKIFEPFVRVPGTVEPGSGIGLATVNRIVRAHGGDVEVTANGKEGVVFVVRLPLCRPDLDATAGDALTPPLLRS